METKFRKKFVIIPISVALIFVLLLWIFGFLYANDLSVQTMSVPSGVEKVLILFPHADDETLTSGGFISQLTKSGKEVDWILLTKGERGNEGAHLDENLKSIRVQEAQKVSAIYGISNLDQEDYPDDAVAEQKDQLKTDLQQKIAEIKPDLVITYDLAGLYGHPDHIAVSEVVTELLKTRPQIKLWYASYPKRILDSVALPEQMANDPNFKDKRSYPTQKVWVGVSGVINKIKAVYTYKSQRKSYIKSFPVKQIPLWLYISLTPFEYYHQVQ